MKKVDFYVETVSSYSVSMYIDDNENPEDFIGNVRNEFIPGNNRQSEEVTNVEVTDYDFTDDSNDNEMYECIYEDTI